MENDDALYMLDDIEEATGIERRQIVGAAAILGYIMEPFTRDQAVSVVKEALSGCVKKKMKLRELRRAVNAMLEENAMPFMVAETKSGEGELIRYTR